jgi:replicative DNA helicase
MTAMPQTAPLSSNDAEQSVIGAMLLMPERAVERVADLRPEHFAHPSHQSIWTAIQSVRESGKPIDAVTVGAEIESNGWGARLKAVGGLSYLVDVQGQVITPANLGVHVDIIRRLAKRRRLVELAKVISNRALENTDADDVLDLVRDEIDALEDEAIPEEPPQPPPTIAEIIRAPSFLRPRVTYPTGYRQLDEILQGGLHSRQLMTIGAPTGVGKTSLVGTIVRALVIKGHPALWIATELSIEEQAARFASISLRAAGHRATANGILSHDGIKPDFAAGAVDGLDLRVARVRRRDGDPFAIIRGHIDAASRASGVRPVVVVDYLQKLAATDDENRRMGVASVSEQLQELAEDTDCHIIAISSVPRSFYNATAKKLRKMRKADEPEHPSEWLAMGKEAGEIEYDAAIIAYLDVADYAPTLDERPARLIIAKNRDGEGGFVGLRFHGPSGLFIEAPESVDAMKPSAGAAPSGLDDVKAQIRKQILRRKKPFTSRNQIAQWFGGDRNRVMKAIDELFEDGELDQEGRGKPIEISQPEDSE